MTLSQGSIWKYKGAINDLVQVAQLEKQPSGLQGWELRVGE